MISERLVEERLGELVAVGSGASAPRRAAPGRPVQASSMEAPHHRGGDRQRDLGGPDRADVDPGGPSIRARSASATPGGRQPLEPRRMAPARAQRGDIAGRRASAATSAGSSILGSWLSVTTAVARSGFSAVTASSGQRSSSITPGKRSGVRNLPRGSITCVDNSQFARQPRQRLRDLDRADDQQPARRIVAVDEIARDPGALRPVARSVATSNAGAVGAGAPRSPRTAAGRNPPPTPAGPAPKSRRRTAARPPTPRHRRRHRSSLLPARRR